MLTSTLLLAASFAAVVSSQQTACYQLDSGFGYTQCYLYTLPTSQYTTTTGCEDGDTLPLDTFYDEFCPGLVPDFEGQSPRTCEDSYCYPIGTLKEPMFYRDQVGSAFNVTNAECKSMCKENPLCKSVFVSLVSTRFYI